MTGMTGRLTVALLLAAIATAQVRAACTPLDPTGEDTGCLPSGPLELKCERFVNKQTILASDCILKCHEKKVAAAVRNRPFDEEACEDTAVPSCRSKFSHAVSLLNPDNCPLCLTQNASNIFPAFESVAESLTPMIFCDPTGIPFDADDGNGATIPTLTEHRVCELKFNRNVEKLIKCIGLQCHRHWVDSEFQRDPSQIINETACEETDPLGSCAARFAASNALLHACPPCLGQAQQTAVFNAVEQAYDQRLGIAYCGSPSGAFVE
ncbi:MAG TPA: hypothetical protein VKW76_08715 [Candidatus Binatia bacterium]|nr:hypothetical protein [Candidatus Binatia bacterium]